MASFNPVKVELVTWDDPLKHIETIGRVCTSSYDKQTDDSAEGFVKRLIERGHESVLEHAHYVINFENYRGLDVVYTIKSACCRYFDETGCYLPIYQIDHQSLGGNVRAWRTFAKYFLFMGEYACRTPIDAVVHTLKDINPLFAADIDCEYLRDKTVCDWHKNEEAFTFYIEASKAITTELLRQRIASFTQASMRLTDYDKNEMRCTDLMAYTSVWESKRDVMSAFMRDLCDCVSACCSVYRNYKDKLPAQVRRHVLNVCMEAPLYMTATRKQWEHILKLRLPAGADPQCRAVAEKIKDIKFETLEI